ncbi:MAG TPA: hypothetical protein VHG11_04205, partial [Pseudorhizobium sp.]|nr:hypothetical protein [Pseudorhizobium sp.]
MPSPVPPGLCSLNEGLFSAIRLDRGKACDDQMPSEKWERPIAISGLIARKYVWKIIVSGHAEGKTMTRTLGAAILSVIALQAAHAATGTV